MSGDVTGPRWVGGVNASKEAVDPYPFLDTNGYRWAVGGGSGAERTYQPRDIFGVINDAKAEARKEALREAADAVDSTVFYIESWTDRDRTYRKDLIPTEPFSRQIRALAEGVSDGQQ